MKQVLWVGGGVMLLAVAGLVIVGKRAVGDPLHGERTKSAMATGSTDAPEEKDTSTQRWRQRLEERQAARAAAIANGETAATGAVGADGRPTAQLGDGNVAAAKAGSVGNGSGRNNGTFAGELGGSTQDAARSARVTPGGAVINTGVGAETQPGAAQGSSGTSRGSSTGTTTAGTGIKTPAVVRGCGDGVLEAGEECEPASSPKCGDDCQPVVSDACYDCEVNSVCVAIANACADSTKSKLEQSLCYDVLHCIQDTACAAGDKTLTSCFCGDMSMTQCRDAPSGGDQAPHGACADVIRDAMGGAVSNAFVLTHYTTNSTPAGVAIKRFQCLKASETCGSVCFKK